MALCQQYTWFQPVVKMDVLFVSQRKVESVSVSLDDWTMTMGSISRSSEASTEATLSPLNAAEGVLVPLLGLDLEVEGASGSGASGKVDAGNLLEAQVHRRLVHVDEASLQRVEKA